MATDGVKIIDSDTAHDTYWGFMDLYDNGLDVAAILEKYPLIDPEPYDEFDHEIYVTACALAYWEIGEMNPERLHDVKSVIDKGAGVAEWNEYSEKDGKARQKVLTTFYAKISKPNLKPRARKKYRKISKLYFQADDVLTFQLKDGTYRAVICCGVDQYRGACNYMFVPTCYDSHNKPTINDLKDEQLLGNRIRGFGDKESFISFQPDVDKIWETIGDNTRFYFGVVQIGIAHKDLSSFKEHFETIGSLKIHDSFKRMGSLGYESSFERLEEIFSDLNEHIKAFRYEKFPIKVICEV